MRMVRQTYIKRKNEFTTVCSSECLLNALLNHESDRYTILGSYILFPGNVSSMVSLKIK